MSRRDKRLILTSIRGVCALGVLTAGCAARAQQQNSVPNEILPAPLPPDAPNATIVVVPIPPPPPDDGPALAEIVEEKRQQYRALLLSELHFCRIACELTRQQGQQIAHRIGPIVEAAALSAAKLDLKPARRGGIRLATDSAPPNPIKLVRTSLTKLASEFTSPAQQSRYRVELEKRDAHRKEIALFDLVARLDRVLILSTDQRARLLRVIDSNWDDEWGAVVDILDHDDAVFPAIPSRLIVPCLSSTQQKLWHKFNILALDATSAYLFAVCACTADLPSEFIDWLKGGALEEVTRPNVDEAARKQKDGSN